MKWLIPFCLIVLFSCEKHTQDGWSLGGEKVSVFSLENSEKMFAAVAQDDYFQLEKLLIADAGGINTPNKEGKLLLHESIRTNRVLVTSLLMKYGASPTDIEEEGGDAFDLLEGKEDKLEWENLLNLQPLGQVFINKQMVEIISEAAEDSQIAIQSKLELYLDMGGDINARNRRKFTLLAIAASKGLPLLTTFLCEHDKVEINAKVGRYTILGLVKRLMRRDSSLKRIADILKEFGAH